MEKKKKKTRELAWPFWLRFSSFLPTFIPLGHFLLIPRSLAVPLALRCCRGKDLSAERWAENQNTSGFSCIFSSALGGLRLVVSSIVQCGLTFSCSLVGLLQYKQEHTHANNCRTYELWEVCGQVLPGAPTLLFHHRPGLCLQFLFFPIPVKFFSFFLFFYENVFDFKTPILLLLFILTRNYTVFVTSVQKCCTGCLIGIFM